MDTFQKAFNRTKRKNDQKRTFTNINTGLNSGYVAYYFAAITDYQNHNLSAALINISKTISTCDINDWKQFAFRANLYEDLNDFSRAITDYEQAIEFATTEIEVYALYHQIGYCHLNQGNDLKAIEFYSYAIEIKSQHRNLKQYEDQEGMDKGVLLGLPFKRIYNNRANAFLNLGQLENCLEDCKISIGYDKNYSNPYLLISQAYSKAGQEDIALQFLNVSAQLGNDSAKSILIALNKR